MNSDENIIKINIKCDSKKSPLRDVAVSCRQFHYIQSDFVILMT